jgi:hypothetical protein
MSAMDEAEDDATTTSPKNGTSHLLERTWNLSSLRKEVSRQSVRCHKKVGKANQRLQLAQQEVDRLTSSDVTLDELEACPNVKELAAQADELQQRLKKLNQLEVLLQDIKGGSVVLPEFIASLAVELDVDDLAPSPTERGPKKEKGPRKMNSFRLPYRRYYTENKTEIRVSDDFWQIEQCCGKNSFIAKTKWVWMFEHCWSRASPNEPPWLFAAGWKAGRRQ